MLDDQRETLRVKEFNQPGACLHCHSSVTNAYREQGIKKGAPGTLDLPINHPDARAQLHKGFEEVCAMPYTEATKLVQHPVTCLDCHDPGTMELRVTRPAFFEGIAALARSDDPLPHLPSIERWRKGKQDEPYDPNFLASRHEMRSLVCAQCHVEYYFQGDGKKVVYPWHKGLKVEQMEAVYDERNFHDWIHAVTGAPMLKAQHPEFEMWSQGTHARAGVSCADCHMPYRRDGAIKISDHHVRSPLLNIARACQTCHRVEESELLARAENIQDRTAKLMRRTETAVHDLLLAIKAGMDAGMSDEQLKEARQYQRQAQWRLDFVNAENSMGFHAAQEAARILGESIDMARKGQISVLQSRSVSSADADGSGGVDEQVVTMNDFVIRFAAQNP